VRQFFLGGRRKAGVVVLAMALAFAGLWGRSHLFHESVYRYGPTSIHEVSSEDGCLMWICDRRSPGISHKLTGAMWDWSSQDAFDMTRRVPIEVRDPLFFRDEIDWQWKWSEFNFGKGNLTRDGREYQFSATKDRGDPEEIERFATTTHLLRNYFGPRSVWVVPYWFIVLVLSLVSGGLILIPTPRRLLSTKNVRGNGNGSDG